MPKTSVRRRLQEGRDGSDFTSTVFAHLKRITSDRRRRLMRQAILREWQRQRQRRRRRKARAQKPQRRYVPPIGAIVAPRRIDLVLGWGPAVRQFLDDIGRRVLIERVPVTVDFRETEAFTLAGTILVFAEIDRIATLSREHVPKPLTLIDPRRRRPREVLKQIGLHGLTGDRCDTVPSRDDVVYWKATKGSDQSGNKLAMIEVVADRVREQYSGQLGLSDLWRAVSEAVANSVDHAYKKPRADGFQGLPDTKWWMFTQIKDGVFFAAVCDLGCGYRATIGETVPERFASQLASLLIGFNKDAGAIHTAMEYGRSGTEEEHRGKGSRDAMSVLEKHQNGELMAISNTGWMAYSYANGREERRHNGSLGTNIKGTILWWKLPLTGPAK
jgi:hypothetical protein